MHRLPNYQRSHLRLFFPLVQASFALISGAPERNLLIWEVLSCADSINVLIAQNTHLNLRTSMRHVAIVQTLNIATGIPYMVYSNNDID